MKDESENRLVSSSSLIPHPYFPLSAPIAWRHRKEARRMIDERLIDLLLRAEDLQQQGRPITAEDLCRTCPELWPELQRLLSGVAQVERLLSPERPEGTSATKPAPWPTFVTPEIRGYKILREIGRGGMGIVYEAVQTSLDRHVDLKVLPNHSFLDPRQLQRFQRESRLVARLHHTNIVPIYG